MFGVEIECISAGKSLEEIRDLFQACGIPVTGYSTENTYKNWNVTYDNTICEDRVTVEVQSPILKSVDEIPNVLKILRSSCYVNHRCGLHVHVSGHRGLCQEDLDYFVKQNYSHLVKIPNRMREKNWCPLLKTMHRYKGIRLVEPNHIEVRLFNGSLNTRYVMKCVEKSIKIYGSLAGIGQPRLPAVGNGSSG